MGNKMETGRAYVGCRELLFSHHQKEAAVFIMYPKYGNLAWAPQQQSYYPN